MSETRAPGKTSVAAVTSGDSITARASTTRSSGAGGAASGDDAGCGGGEC